MSHELYEILGVNKDASHEDIKTAYRDGVKRWHPDKNPGDPKSEERFKAISFAYETLGDPTQRQLYDLSVDLPNGTTVNPDEVARLFTAVFGSFMDDKIPLFKKYAQMYEKMQEEKLEKKKKKHRRKKDPEGLLLHQGGRTIRVRPRKT